MTVEQWGIVIGMIVAAVGAIAPWMLMVHAKLAVLGTQITSMESKVDKLLDDQEQRLPVCAVHEARLETLEAELEILRQQMKDME